MPPNVSKYHILLGCSGNVSSDKVPLIVNGLFNEAHSRAFALEIKIIATDHALHHFSQVDLSITSRNIMVYLNQYERNSANENDEAALHNELISWADMLLIAPLSSNCLAKFDAGQKDTLLTYVMHSWDKKKPLVVAPAMETEMYLHPLATHLFNELKKKRIYLIEPLSKKSTDSKQGPGTIASIPSICSFAMNLAQRKIDLYKSMY